MKEKVLAPNKMGTAKSRGLMDRALENARKRYVVETRMVMHPDGVVRPFPVKVYPNCDARLARFDKKD